MEEWKTRDLSDVEFDYLFLDGSHFKMHPGAQAEPVLCAWGINTDGKPVFVGLDAASSESTDGWDDFLTDLKRRGLRPPLLVTTDGSPGLLAAVELHLGESLHQRCVIQWLRNAVAKVSKYHHTEFKADWWKVLDDIDADPGDAAIAEAKKRAGSFADKWGDRYPERQLVSPMTSRRSPPTCGSPPNIASAYVTPTSSNAPSVRPGGESK